MAGQMSLEGLQQAANWIFGKMSPKKKDNSLRPDGTRKNIGFFGPLRLKGGGHATEYSIGTSDIDGIERDIPSLVPTLTPEELKVMVETIIPNDLTPPPNVSKKAVEYARKRIAAGKSPFYDPAEDR